MLTTHVNISCKVPCDGTDGTDDILPIRIMHDLPSRVALFYTSRIPREGGSFIVKKNGTAGCVVFKPCRLIVLY